MGSVMQMSAKTDLMFVSPATNTAGDFKTVILTDPKVGNGKMLLVTSIPDWNADLSFFTDLDYIDSPNVRLHIMWKMSGDNGYVIQLKVQGNWAAKNYSDLGLHTWRFL